MDNSINPANLTWIFILKMPISPAERSAIEPCRVRSINARQHRQSQHIADVSAETRFHFRDSMLPHLKLFQGIMQWWCSSRCEEQRRVQRRNGRRMAFLSLPR
jgi:hypothetical protein